MIETLIKYGPPVLGLVGLIGSIAFFVGKFLLGRIYNSIDILFAKLDAQEKSISNIKIMLAAREDSKTMVGKLMGK